MTAHPSKKTKKTIVDVDDKEDGDTPEQVELEDDPDKVHEPPIINCMSKIL